MCMRVLQKHQWYAQCLTQARGERNVATQMWDGKRLECGSVEMRSGNAPAGYTPPGRRLQQAEGCDDMRKEYAQCAGGTLPAVTACEDGLVCVKVRLLHLLLHAVLN